ncbi:transient receptor potential cation channel subfamily V member 6-like [Mizuhopecten yessoensis]|uniref:Transient receptor potential cation channel subfamily V member 6 n=1 Tax=Mizuhopecten yessoensis TaxID=6573 RepID=A0A210PVU1_MIZYE|nr:transient receptor potential cation channel subfamily V member 6-like [Mizuhopecten yessoensis]OWF40586.1 Transient receptor potential cation channel subfamily V member 6 [Mizuhopecten yessoensis]
MSTTKVSPDIQITEVSSDEESEKIDSVNLMDTKSSSLHSAIIYGDLEEVTELINNGSSINEKVKGNFSIQSGTKKSKEINYAEMDYYGEYPLAFATSYANEEIYDFLINHGADPDLPDSYGNTVLHVAVVADKIEMFKFCVRHPKKPANTVAKNNANFTPLSLACKLGRHSLFKAMLEMGSLEFWRYSNTTCSAYPLLALDSIGPSGNTNMYSALILIINGETDDHLELLEGGVMRQLLDEKWERYAKKWFFQRLIMAFVHLILISVAVYTRPAEGLLLVHGVKDIVRFVSEILVCIGCVLILIIDIGEVASQGFWAFLKNSRHSPAQTIFLFSCLLIMLCIPLRFTGYETAESVLLIVAVPGSWFYLLFFAKGYPLTGPMIVMTYQMLATDMMKFGSMYGIFVLLFSQVFYFLFQGTEGIPAADNIWETSMTLFQMTLGEFKYDDFEKTKYPALTKTVFVFFMVLVPILLLNMLIAMMGNTYQQVVSKSAKEWRRQWAKIVVVLEKGFTKKNLLKFQMEYSVKLSGEPRVVFGSLPKKDSAVEQRGLVVIKQQNRTVARKKKAAISFWRRANKLIVDQIRHQKKNGLTGQLNVKPSISRRVSMLSDDDNKGFSTMLERLAWEKDIDLTKGKAFMTNPDDIEGITHTAKLTDDK